MILGKTHPKALLSPARALFVFVTGVVFCGLIWLQTIYFMVTAGGDDLYYLLSKRFGPLSYVGWATLIFIGFSLMAILLIPARKKIYSIALFVSCLSIAFNTQIFRESARLLYIDNIKSLQHTMESIENGGDFHYLEHVWRGLEDRDNYLPRLKLYYSHVADRWREVEGPTFQPVENAYWSEQEKATFNGNEYTCWRASQEKSHSTLPSTLFFSANGKAVGLLPDGVRLFGFTNPEAARTNDFHQDYIAFTLETDKWPLEIRAVKTNGTMRAETSSYWVGDTMTYHLHESLGSP